MGHPYLAAIAEHGVAEAQSLGISQGLLQAVCWFGGGGGGGEACLTSETDGNLPGVTSQEQRERSSKVEQEEAWHSA